MNKKSLTRSIPYWLLVVVSLVSAAVGAWLVSDQIKTMTTTLLDGTATGVEVYVGQAWVVVGAALLGAGVVGVLLALVLAAVKALLPAAAPVVVEPIDWTAEPEASTVADTEQGQEVTATEAVTSEASDDAAGDNDSDEEDQNGSSGSTAMATNSNVK